MTFFTPPCFAAAMPAAIVASGLSFVPSPPVAPAATNTAYLLSTRHVSSVGDLVSSHGAAPSPPSGSAPPPDTPALPPALVPPLPPPPPLAPPAPIPPAPLRPPLPVPLTPAAPEPL